MKEALYRTLTKFLSLFLRKRKAEAAAHFLVVSTTGVGDTLWAVPALRALQKHYPKAPITLLLTPTSKALLEPLAFHTHLLEIKNRSLLALIKLFPRLREGHFSHALVFHSSQRAMLPMLHLAGIPSIIGTKGTSKGFDNYLTTGLQKQEEHEILRRLKLCAHVGALTSDTKLALHVGKDEETHIKERLSSLGHRTDKPLITLHLGAKDAYKQWPLSHFIDLGKRLIEAFEAQLCVTGSAHETDLAKAFVSQVPSTLNLCNQLSLTELTALIQVSDLLISNDTGPMHMGFALKTRTLAFFSPTNPALCGPLNLEPHLYRLCYETPTCTPCLGRRCPLPFCHMQTGVDRVMIQASELLKNKQTSRLKPVTR